jgi:hypothetical protein
LGLCLSRSYSPASTELAGERNLTGFFYAKFLKENKMDNVWNHPDILAAEAMRHMEDALVIVPMCATDKTSEFTTTANGWKVGDTVSFRTHGEYAVDSFAGNINIQPITTSSRSLTIEEHFDVSVEVTAREMKLDLDSFSDQVIRPAVYKMAETVDSYVGTKILQAAGLYTSANLFTSAADIALARKAATIQQLEMDRFCLTDLDTEATLLGQEWFNQAQSRGVDGVNTLASGIMGRVMGMNFASSLGFPTGTHNPGDVSGVLTDNTAGAANVIGMSVLTIAAGGTGSLVVGDRIQVAGCRRPLKVAVDIADISAVTSIQLVDPITEVITDTAAVTVIGGGVAAIDFHSAIFDSRSLAVGFPMLDIPGDKVAGTASSNGINVRVVTGYAMDTKTTTMSIDMLAGAFALDPRRITLCGNVV